MAELKKASLWLSEFENSSKEFNSYLESIYGSDISLIARKKEKYLAVLNEFISEYGDKDVIISRAPGRINLMGRHVEHRGGNINTIAIHKETIMVAAKRDDDIISITNTDKRFSPFSFSISKEKKLSGATTWLDYIDSDNVKEIVLENKGHWVNYVKGAALRFQFEVDTPLAGMDIMCLGTVPIAGGVSSSSSVVMATAELLYEFNSLSFDVPDFINLCGQSEWYVGSRGGAGDHAAIKCGVLNSFSPIAFEPIRVLPSAKIPEKYLVIVADSFIAAKKSEGAKDRFNQMVASYEFGVMLIKKNFPQFEEKIIHLRDINPENLGVSEKEIYKMLLSLPVFLKTDELFKEIPQKFHEKVNKIVKSHAAPDAYNLRSAMLFGIAECARSKICASLLNDGKISEFADIMNISHCGDRVAMLKKGNTVEYDYILTDEKLNDLINRCDKNDDSAMLYKQPGGYACSIPKIDELIDKVLNEKGVLSAQISGAGLGGCIMIFLEKEYEKDVLSFLEREYYKPNGFKNGAIVVRPIKGSMCL